MNVKNIFIHFNDNISINDLINILLKFDYTRVYNIEISFKEWFAFSNEEIDKIISFKRVQQIYFIENQNSKKTFNHFKIKFISNSIEYYCQNSPKSINDFFINIIFFTESLNYHSYFNKRIAIDPFGDIKNDVTLLKNYGNFKKNTLQEIIENNDIKKLWHISKDITLICKDCEYRYMCMDSREPVSISENVNLWYHKSECDYNPYIAKWRSEDGYVSMEQCGTYTLEKVFIIDKKKVQKLNEQIWG